MKVKSNNIFSKFKSLRKSSPAIFYFIIIGSIIGLIVIIIILNASIKYCKSYKRRGYTSQFDSDVGRSNKISGTNDF